MRAIYCCNCAAEVSARLTSGAEVYPHRPDLRDLPFWRCDGCGGFVGCHHKTRQRTRPLGVIASPAIKNARRHIHALLDPLWQSGQIDRKRLYQDIGKHLGHEYHTGEIRTIEEAREVYVAARRIAAEIKQRSGHAV